MGIASFWVFELAEFFRKEGLHIFFIQAKMEGRGDELLDGRVELDAAGFDLQRGSLVGNVGTDASLGFDKTLAFQNLVNFADGQRVNVQLGGKFADGRKLRPVRQLPGKDTLLELLLQLHVEGDAAVGVKEEHAVLHM